MNHGAGGVCPQMQQPRPIAIMRFAGMQACLPPPPPDWRHSQHPCQALETPDPVAATAGKHGLLAGRKHMHR